MNSTDMPQDKQTGAPTRKEEVATPRRELKQRYDGYAKLTGSARYAIEFQMPGAVYAFLVQSTIPKGTIASIDRAAAERAYGVLAVLTPFNAARLPVPPSQPHARRAVSLLQDRAVHYNGQPIAVVVAASLDQAPLAATLLKIEYIPEPPQLDFMGRLDQGRPLKQPTREPADSRRGDLAASMARATVTLEETHTTPIQNHNSMETHSTLTWWEGRETERLQLHPVDRSRPAGAGVDLRHTCQQRPRAVSLYRRRVREQGIPLVARLSSRDGCEGGGQAGEARARSQPDVRACRLASHDSAEDQARCVGGRQAAGHVPVNADIGEIDLTVLNIPDTRFSPLGARGIGEVATTGVAAAIANAVYNATGKRVRNFPITVDKIMAAAGTTA